MFKLKTYTVFDEKFERSFLTILLGCTVGLYVVCIIIWNRLIRERLPKELLAEAQPCNSYTFWLILYLFVINSLYIILDLYRLQKNLRGITKTNPYVTKFVEILNKSTLYRYLRYYVALSPLFLFYFIYMHLPKRWAYNLVDRPLFKIVGKIYEKFFNIHCNYILRQTWTLMILVYFPRILAYSVLLYEIVINHKIDLFYSIAPILLIPLFSRVINRTMYEHCCKIIRGTQIYFELEHLARGKGLDWEPTRLRKKTATISDKAFEDAFRQYSVCEPLVWTSLDFISLIEKYNRFFSPLISI